MTLQQLDDIIYLQVGFTSIKVICQLGALPFPILSPNFKRPFFSTISCKRLHDEELFDNCFDDENEVCISNGLIKLMNYIEFILQMLSHVERLWKVLTLKLIINMIRTLFWKNSMNRHTYEEEETLNKLSGMVDPHYSQYWY